MGQVRDRMRHQITESTNIDELWKAPSPLPASQSIHKNGGGKCAEEVFHNAEEDIPECCLLESDESDGGKVDNSFGASSGGEGVESYIVGNRSVRIPEVGGCNSIEEELCRGEGEKLNRDVLPSLNMILHTNELFDSDQKHNAASPISRKSVVPVHLQFDDIKYKVVMEKDGYTRKKTFFRMILGKTTAPAPTSEKLILNGISGAVAPGEILAMMGPSGSGKTTMLNILGGRLPNDKSIGTLMYNGSPYTSVLKRRIGYVSQDDILFPILTVRETLVFSALLRLSRKLSHEEKVERAETVLKELGLERCKNTIVGGPFIRGVSGGERKRTSIGYEILVEPSLLLLDEPTSGLDSSTALRIVQILRANAEVGRVIVTTIHQPSSRIFHMFDKLLVLSEGHPIYFGAAKNAMDYFMSLQFIPQLAMNPSDFLIDLASGITNDITVPREYSFLKSGRMAPGNGGEGPKTEEYKKRVKSLNMELVERVGATQTPINTIPEDLKRQHVMMYLRLKYKSELEGKVDGKGHPSFEGVQVTNIEVKEHWNSTWFEQFNILCRRNCKERKKDYLNLLKFSQGLAVASLLGMLWWQTKLETEQDIRDQLGLLFYVCIFWCTSSMWSTLMIFPLEKSYIAKDRASGMYCLSAYYLSSTCCDLMAELVHPTLFIILVIFMTGLKCDFITFGLTLLAVYLIAITAQAIGEFFGAATLSTKRVGIVSSMILLIFLLAGGYYVQNIPIWLRWIRYVSVVYYGFNLLQRIQYSPDQTYNCQGFDGCLRYDESPVFANMNLNGGMHDALALIAMAFVYKIMAYICLRRT